MVLDLTYYGLVGAGTTLDRIWLVVSLDMVNLLWGFTVTTEQIKDLGKVNSFMNDNLKPSTVAKSSHSINYKEVFHSHYEHPILAASG